MLVGAVVLAGIIALNLLFFGGGPALVTRCPAKSSTSNGPHLQPGLPRPAGCAGRRQGEFILIGGWALAIHGHGRRVVAVPRARAFEGTRTRV